MRSVHENHLCVAARVRKITGRALRTALEIHAQRLGRACIGLLWRLVEPIGSGIRAKEEILSGGGEAGVQILHNVASRLAGGLAEQRALVRDREILARPRFRALRGQLRALLFPDLFCKKCHVKTMPFYYRFRGPNVIAETTLSQLSQIGLSPEVASSYMCNLPYIA